MKILLTLALVALPAAAQACGGPGGARGGCGIAPFLICAVIAALGYWVLQHAGKDNPVYVKRTGAVVGFALIVIGLLGLLCTLGSHARKSMSCGMCQEHKMMGQGMQAGQGGGGNGGGQGGNGGGQGGNGGGQGGVSSMPEEKPAVPAKK